MRYFEVTSVDTGETTVMPEDECRRMFGRAEWVEIVAGYLPHIVAMEVDPGGEEPCPSCDCLLDDYEDHLACEKCGWGP